MFTDDFDPNDLARLNDKEFLRELSSLRQELQQLIEAECDGFDPDPEASKERRKRAFNDFQYLAYTYFPHYIKGDPSEFQKFFYSEVPKRIDEPEGHKDAYAGPRGNAKSTLLLILSIWCIVTGRKWFLVIIMDAFDQAVMQLEGIKVEFESNPRLRQDFPNEVGAGRVWQAGTIITRTGRKVQVAGSGKKLRGWRHGPHRPDLVLLDDIENDENVRKKEQRDKTEDWVDKAVLKLGPPDDSMDLIWVGTVLHYDAAFARKLKSPTWYSKRFKAIVKYPDRMDLWEKWEEILFNQDQEHAKRLADEFYSSQKEDMDAGAVVSWPSTQPIHLLMKFRADGHRAFDSEYQNDPGNDELAPFRDIQFWVHPCRDWVFYGSCDPSMGKKSKRNDPSAILVGGFDRNHFKLDVVEAQIARKVPDKIISDIIELEKEYRCMVWIFEIVQFQEFVKDVLVQRSALAGIPVPARGVIPITDKDLRIESLSPHVANGLIRIHRNHTVLYEQLRYWPEADHDDGPDALQMLWMAAYSGAGGVPRILSARSRHARKNSIEVGHG